MDDMLKYYVYYMIAAFAVIILVGIGEGIRRIECNEKGGYILNGQCIKEGKFLD